MKQKESFLVFHLEETVNCIVMILHLCHMPIEYSKIIRMFICSKTADTALNCHSRKLMIKKKEEKKCDTTSGHEYELHPLVTLLTSKDG